MSHIKENAIMVSRKLIIMLTKCVSRTWIRYVEVSYRFSRPIVMLSTIAGDNAFVIFLIME